MSTTSTNRLLLTLEGLAGLGVVAAIIGKSYGAAPTVFFMLAGTATAFSAYMLVRVGASWRDEALDIEGRTQDTERERLEQEKHLLLQGIKELEADVSAGKVDKRDYDHLRRTAEDRAIDIIETIKKDDTKWLKEAERHFERRIGRSPLVTAGPSSTVPLAGVSVGLGVTSGVEPADPKCFDDRSARFEMRETVLVCTACAQPNDADAQFCIGCGRPREADAPATSPAGAPA